MDELGDALRLKGFNPTSKELVKLGREFLKRLWAQVFDHLHHPVGPDGSTEKSDEAKDFKRKTHETIAKVRDDVGRRLTFNTAIAALMELSNTINRFDVVNRALEEAF